MEDGIGGGGDIEHLSANPRAGPGVTHHPHTQRGREFLGLEKRRTYANLTGLVRAQRKLKEKVKKWSEDGKSDGGA